MDRLPSVRTWILIKESGEEIESGIPFACEFEDVHARSRSDYRLPDFDENSQATLSYTTGDRGRDRGPLA